MSAEVTNEKMTTFQWGEHHEKVFFVRVYDAFVKLKTDIVIRRVNVKDKMYCVDFVLKKRKLPLCYVELKSRQYIKPRYNTLRIGYTKMCNIRDEIQINKKSSAYLVWWCVKKNIIFYVKYDDMFCQYEKFWDEENQSYYIHIHKDLLTKGDIFSFAQYIMSVSNSG